MENINEVEINWEDIVSALSKTKICKILVCKIKLDIKNYFEEQKKEAMEIANKTKLDIKKFGLKIAFFFKKNTKKGSGKAKSFLKKVWKKINDKIPYTISIKITKKVVE